jgi:hypothetical protein
VSFGKELRAKRQATLPFLALIATAALSAPMVTPPPPVVTSSAQQTAPREFADTQTAKPTRHTKKSVKRAKPRAGAKWDSRKARRAILMRMAGLDNSGRQWVRARKMLRRSPVAHLLAMPAWELAQFAKTHRLVRTTMRAA